MHIAYLLLGGNLGNREIQLRQAKMELERRTGRITGQSSLYETAAWGNRDQPSFLNQAVELETELPATELMSRILEIEKDLGRKRQGLYGPRTIDIDILLYDDEIHVTDHLRVPHPRLPERRFALEPLAELIPSYLHPVLKKTISGLLNDCADPLPVHKIER
ncbi:MAG TPA: 2-amino-4-hydroxy-6-hydroxymethyldihydropteridine diphosphokinase [Flavihumibacter sp.]